MNAINHINTINYNFKENICNAISKIYQVYLNAIKNLIIFFEERNWDVVGRLIGSILIEPLQIARAAITYPLGWKNHFDFYSCNPEQLTKEQRKHRPLLLLHGYGHNQSAWLPLAKKLSDRALFTLNLSGEITQDLKLIKETIKKIKNLTPKKIDLLGHSAGAEKALYLLYVKEIKDGYLKFKINKKIERIILIGHPLTQWWVDRIKAHFGEDELEYFLHHHHEIIGSEDLINRDRSLEIVQNKLVVKAGHLGVLYSDEVHEQIDHWLDYDPLLE